MLMLMIGLVVDVVLLETTRGRVMTFIPIPRAIDESSMRKSTCKISSAFDWKASYDNGGLCAIKNANVHTPVSQKAASMALAYNT